MGATASVHQLRASWATRLGLSIGLLSLLVGCGSAPKQVDTDALDLSAQTLPQAEPKSRYGNMASYVVFGKRYYTKRSSRNHIERGLASWYGKKFHGRKTSSGERYDMHRMTAAHKTLPLPTYALVTNLENGRSAVVRVNDRGPFVGNRIIDLSYAAAKRLDMVNAGTARVEVRSIDPRDHGKDAKELLRLASVDVGVRRSSALATPADGISGPRSAGLSSRSSGPSRSAEPAPAAAAPTRSSPPAGPFLANGFGGSSTTASRSRSETAAADGRPLFLQVGAFGSLGNAEQLKSQLSQRVDEPVIVRAAEADHASQTLYKVQIGPVRSRVDADALGRRLVALGIDKPVLVVH